MKYNFNVFETKTVYQLFLSFDSEKKKKNRIMLNFTIEKNKCTLYLKFSLFFIFTVSFDINSL